MHPRETIQILHSGALDKARWDSCVEADPQALIYSSSWFLDIMADDWYGIVVNDYQAVMALPIKKKWGIKMIATPPFAQRLGVAGSYDGHLLEQIGQKALASGNLIRYSAAEEFLFRKGDKRRRTNFILSLAADYEKIASNYTSPCRKNINKAQKRGCTLCEDVTIRDVIRIYRDAYGARAAYTELHFARLERFLNSALERKQCYIAGVRNESGHLVYAGLFPEDGKRLYYLLGAPTEEGRQMRATYFFINEMIRRFAGTGKVFDFEGSDIPDVANFYRSFSPETEYYYQFYINQYPFPVNKLLDRKLSDL